MAGIEVGVGSNATDWPGRQFVKGHHTHSRDVGGETEGFPQHGSCNNGNGFPRNGWMEAQLWIVKRDWQESITPSQCRFLPHSSQAYCGGKVVVSWESKDWHACLHNSSSVIRTWCTLTLLMTPHMLVDTTGKCHAMLVSDRPLFQILSPNYYWIFIQINCHFSGGEKCTPIFHKEHLSEQAAGQDGFGNCARQVQQTLGHHPRPGELKSAGPPTIVFN